MRTKKPCIAIEEYDENKFAIRTGKNLRILAFLDFSEKVDKIFDEGYKQGYKDAINEMKGLLTNDVNS